MTSDFAEIWSYLAKEPLIWLSATLVAYVLGDSLAGRFGRHPLVNPVLVAVILLAVLLWITATPYATYFEGAQFVHFLLGPATVALALPLWRNAQALRRAILPVMTALLVGAGVAITSALALGKWLGLPPSLLAALAPKSVTAPVAIGVAETVGASPTLTAVLVILTGMTGAIVVTPLMQMMGIRDWRARGFAVGVAAHGLGTARALQVNPQAGAFAAIGMALNALLTAACAPYILRWFL